MVVRCRVRNVERDSVPVRQQADGGHQVRYAGVKAFVVLGVDGNDFGMRTYRHYDEGNKRSGLEACFHVELWQVQPERLPKDPRESKFSETQTSRALRRGLVLCCLSSLEEILAEIKAKNQARKT